MEEIRGFTRDIVAKAQGFTDDAEGAFPDLEVTCPQCGKGPFKENVRLFKCRGCGLSVWKSLAGRPLERSEITTLLEKKIVGPLEGFRSRFGKPFSAELEFDPEWKLKFVFGEREGDPAAEEALRVTLLGVAGSPRAPAGSGEDGGVEILAGIDEAADASPKPQNPKIKI
jgi:DNA topoisomerase-3